MALIVVVIASGLYFLLAEKGSDEIITIKSTSHMKDIELVHVKGGKKKWAASIAKAFLLENNKDILLEDMDFNFIKQGLSVVSKEGVYGIQDNILTIPGDVLASTNDYNVHTKNVRVDFNTQNIETLSNSSIYGNDMAVKADRVEELNKKRMVLTGNVRAEFK